MTPQEAIETLRQMKKDCEVRVAKAYNGYIFEPNDWDQYHYKKFSEASDALGMAISALEKQDVSEINVGDMISRQAEPLELQFEQVGTHIIKTCPTCHTPWRVPPTSEYLKIAKYPCCPCGQRIRWERRDE